VVIQTKLFLGGGVCLLLEVWVGRTWIPPRWLHLAGTWVDSLVLAGVLIREMNFRLYRRRCDTAKRGLRPKSSPLTLRCDGLPEGHAAKRGLWSRASVHPGVTWLPLPEVVGPLPELHERCSCSFIQIIPLIFGVLTPAASVSTEG